MGCGASSSEQENGSSNDRTGVCTGGGGERKARAGATTGDVSVDTSSETVATSESYSWGSPAGTVAVKITDSFSDPDFPAYNRGYLGGLSVTSTSTIAFEAVTINSSGTSSINTDSSPQIDVWPGKLSKDVIARLANLDAIVLDTRKSHGMRSPFTYFATYALAIEAGRATNQSEKAYKALSGLYRRAKKAWEADEKGSETAESEVLKVLEEGRSKAVMQMLERSVKQSKLFATCGQTLQEHLNHIKATKAKDVFDAPKRNKYSKVDTHDGIPQRRAKTDSAQTNDIEVMDVDEEDDDHSSSPAAIIQNKLRMYSIANNTIANDLGRRQDGDSYVYGSDGVGYSEEGYWMQYLNYDQVETGKPTRCENAAGYICWLDSDVNADFHLNTTQASGHNGVSNDNQGPCHVTHIPGGWTGKSFSGFEYISGWGSDGSMSIAEKSEEFDVSYKDPTVVPVPEEAGGGYLMVLVRTRYPLDPTTKTRVGSDSNGMCITDVVCWWCSNLRWRGPDLHGPFLLIDSLDCLHNATKMAQAPKSNADFKSVDFRCWLGVPAANFVGSDWGIESTTLSDVSDNTNPKTGTQAEMDAERQPALLVYAICHPNIGDSANGSPQIIDAADGFDAAVASYQGGSWSDKGDHCVLVKRIPVAAFKKYVVDLADSKLQHEASWTRASAIPGSWKCACRWWAPKGIVASDGKPATSGKPEAVSGKPESVLANAQYRVSDMEQVIKDRVDEVNGGPSYVPPKFFDPMAIEVNGQLNLLLAVRPGGQMQKLSATENTYFGIWRARGLKAARSVHHFYKDSWTEHVCEPGRDFIFSTRSYPRGVNRCRDQICVSYYEAGESDGPPKVNLDYADPDCCYVPHDGKWRVYSCNSRELVYHEASEEAMEEPAEDAWETAS